MTDAIAVDLTALRPVALDDRGDETPIWPTFCLPWYAGEPPIVAEAARVHRRASRAAEEGLEWALSLQNRARFHLAEGWLAMARQPDSLEPSATRMEWRPPGEDRPVSIEFSQVIEAVLQPWSGRDLELALVVPDGLGPGPREELLNRLGRHFRSIHFVPRTIAAASVWCGGRRPESLARLNGAQHGGRLGSLLVTTAPADTWEAALVPIRVERDGGRDLLCPVHERTVHPSELGFIGLEQLWSSLTSAQGDSELESWTRILGQGAAANTFDSTAHTSATSRAAFHSRTLPRLLDHAWTPSGDPEVTLKAVTEVRDRNQLLEWLHVGRPGETSLPNALEGVANLLGAPHEVMPPTKLLPAALDVPERIRLGGVPYYEALARIDMYVEARNAYHDPVSSWRPLIEATEVPVGQVYKSPEPIADLLLPSGKQPSVDVFVRSQRRGRDVYGMTRATQRDPQTEPDPLHIEARLDPGQGLARIEVRSQEARRFQLSIREADLRPVESPPEVRYGWPPGSAWVVSYPSLVQPAWAAIDATDASRATTASLKAVRDTMNTWQLPRQYNVRIDSIDAPEEIHPEFIYLGVFPSSDCSANSDVNDYATRYGDLLVDCYRTPRLRNFKKAVLWNASWLYLHCPEEILSEIRGQLRTLPRLSEAALACVGNCFSQPADFRLFFTALLESIRYHTLPADQYWIRAYRNMTRFRVGSLSLDVLGPEEQDTILRWYLNTFEQAMPNPNGQDFLHCVYLAPHILKRRRFDTEFIAKGSAIYRRVEATYQEASRAARYGRHRDNMRCALEFLGKTATTVTLQRLSSAGG